MVKNLIFIHDFLSSVPRNTHTHQHKEHRLYNDLCFLIVIFVRCLYFMYMGMYYTGVPCVFNVHRGQKRRMNPLGRWLGAFWELNPSPVLEQQVLLMTKPSLQLQHL